MKSKSSTREDLVPSAVKLQYYSNDEVKNLSVVKIYSPVSFNTLGHPAPGGLYDLLMGPISERGDPCLTCGNNFTKCKGHIGHIELPVPVINTLFFREVQLILKISCFNCYKINIPLASQLLFINQIKLLNAGYVAHAKDLDQMFEEKLNNYPTESIKEMNIYVDGILKHGAKICDINYYKGGEELRNSFVSQVLSKQMKRTCLHCKNHINAIAYQQRKIIKSFKIVQSRDNNNHDTSMDSKRRIREQNYVMPSEIQNDFQKLYDTEKTFLKYLVPVLNYCEETIPTDIMFLKYIVVPPNNTRPLSIDKMPPVENRRNHMYQNIIYSCTAMKSIIAYMNNENKSELLMETIKGIRGETINDKLQFTWHELQQNVDILMDINLSITKLPAGQAEGLKQMVDGKTGIIRQNMMGKRVNYAGRSVITPDPYMNIDSIGVPIEFAKTLTYPVPVTPWNVTLLRKMVVNGPLVHPGANLIQNEDGSIMKISPFSKVQRESLAKRLITPEGNVAGSKIIYRHLLNGDMLLVNRQPTLHKPSIMAHKAKILSGEKTLRLHYANCKAYNADFDGDEMNIHLPQDEVSRAEASFLMNVCNQYLVPKDGTPLSGLIQDHVISGAKLSLRDNFLNRSEYMDLVYQALYIMKDEIKILPPTIWKPKPLWTGKQVLSTVIINLTPKNKSPINLKSSSKIPIKAWKFIENKQYLDNPSIMSDFEVNIRHGELLSGILDKKQFGSTQFGLVHAFYDLYGGEYAIRLLSCLAKLFTIYLQRVGFTLGVQDILVKLDADKKRSKIIKKAKNIGVEAACNALGLPMDTPLDEIRSNLEEAYATIPQFRAQIDRQYKTLLDEVTNNINKTCLPKGLIQPFPENNLQFMVESGAKGSTVNTMQISCLLGQIELEGKRPAMMVSGRTLPSFIPYEVLPRAGGFIDGRFMTGIQPQEFFFHCMAGREGLIDTAVKTSRSGYLQRCLIKHLEGLSINYDMTVRDSDKSVIQFLYGEDGLDVIKRQYLCKNQLKFLEDNITSIVDKTHIGDLKENKEYKSLMKIQKKINSFLRDSDGSKYISRIVDDLNVDCKNKDQDSSSNKTVKDVCPDPLISSYQPDAHFGSISEEINKMADSYNSKNSNKFKQMIFYKNLLSLADPGENVGILAAQSIGEPSTQMTLNTFHFAGRGDMNVTLGIPRLREILMMATKDIKTPSMEIPFLPNISKLEKKSTRLAKSLFKLTVADILEKVKVKEKIEILPDPHMNYEIKFYFIPKHMYRDKTCVKPKEILHHIETCFLKQLEHSIAKKLVQSKTYIDIEQDRDGGKEDKDFDEDFNEDSNKDGASKRKSVVGVGNDDSSDEDDRDEDDALQSHKKINQMDDNDFEEPEQDEKEMMGNEEGEEEEEEDFNLSQSEKLKQKSKSNKDKTDPTDSETNEDEDDEDLDERAKDVINNHNMVNKYTYDKKNLMWCKVTLWLTLNCHRVDMSNVIRTCATKSIIHQVPGVNRAIIMESDGKHILKTDGININYISQFRHLLDLNKLYVNDIHYMAQTYGIEAANRVIIKEVKNVFAVYGIEVDPRHLSLVADYMTHSGSYVAMNRNGIKLNPSFIQKLTFEMPLEKIRQASLQSRTDSLLSPSARIMFGQHCLQGTGIFSLRNKFVKTKNTTQG